MIYSKQGLSSIILYSGYEDGIYVRWTCRCEVPAWTQAVVSDAWGFAVMFQDLFGNTTTPVQRMVEVLRYNITISSMHDAVYRTEGTSALNLLEAKGAAHPAD